MSEINVDWWIDWNVSVHQTGIKNTKPHIRENQQ